MPQPRPLPNHALWAWEEATGELETIIRALRPLLADGHQFTRTEQIRRLGLAVASAQHALIELERVRREN